MASFEHLAFLHQGASFWNAWRTEKPDTSPDLSKAVLRKADLRRVQFDKVDLSGADLRRANLSGSSMRNANLNGANLTNALLSNVDFSHSSLRHAELRHADLCGSILSGAELHAADLRGADLNGVDLVNTELSDTSIGTASFRDARLMETLFVDIDLSHAQGLDRCRHHGPCTIDHRTLERSKEIPINFWRGCGLPEQLLNIQPSLAKHAPEFCSCFLSYSSQDQEFADRLHADLQDHGIRCWFAPRDLPIGAKIHEVIDDEIHVRDKVVLILSETSVLSSWVHREVKSALKEEASGRQLLFPLRIDDAVMNTTAQWAYEIKETRLIGDFTNWKDHDAYKATFERVLRDLKTKR